MIWKTRYSHYTKNKTLEYAKRNYMQRIDELEGERKKLLKLSNDCQSEYKLVKSN